MAAVRRNKASGVVSDGRRVIAMSLYGRDPRYTWGALRNAQLVPVHLPDWTLRVYVAADPAPPRLAVPPRIVNKLRLLGVEVARVSATGNSMAASAARNWRLLAADDRRLDYFLVRDADTRLSKREAAAVRDWTSTVAKLADDDRGAPHAAGALHCVRDHPKHADRPLVDGLWGGRPRALRSRLNKNLTDILGLASATSREQVTAILSDVLWPAVANVSYCHDSVSACTRWTGLSARRPFPESRSGHEYVGQKFDQHQQLVSTDGDQLKSDVVCSVTSASLQSLPSNYTTFQPTLRITGSSRLATAGNTTTVAH